MDHSGILGCSPYGNRTDTSNCLIFSLLSLNQCLPPDTIATQLINGVQDWDRTSKRCGSFQDCISFFASSKSSDDRQHPAECKSQKSIRGLTQFYSGLMYCSSTIESASYARLIMTLASAHLFTTAEVWRRRSTIESPEPAFW